MHMLQNAVYPQEELRQVKNQADQLQTFSGRSIGYDSYCKLLLSAASNLDAKHAPKGRMGAPKRNVYAHEFGDFDEDEFHDAYNLDSDVGDLQANAHRQQPRDPRFARGKLPQNLRIPTPPTTGSPQKPRLSFQQWESLQLEARATWDLLSDEAKAIILGLRKDPGKCTINLHDISAFDFLQANFHNQLDEVGDPVEIPPDPDEDQDDPTPQLDEDTSTALL